MAIAMLAKGSFDTYSPNPQWRYLHAKSPDEMQKQSFCILFKSSGFLLRAKLELEYVKWRLS